MISKIMENSSSPAEFDATMPIAVVGIGCRCAGDATNPENLFEMVKKAREAWQPIPKDRYNNEAFYHPDANRNGTVSRHTLLSVRLLMPTKVKHCWRSLPQGLAGSLRRTILWNDKFRSWSKTTLPSIKRRLNMSGHGSTAAPTTGNLIRGLGEW
jgi:hypothetical protein